jgi:hypothetical protein
MNPTDSCNYRNGCGSVRSHSTDGLFRLYPNPVHDRLKIVFENQLQEKVTVIIQDIIGKVVLKLEGNKIQYPVNELELNTAALEKGIYFVTINTASGFHTEEIIISH